MSSFSADWLSLREPLDAASRAAGLGAMIAPALRPAGRPGPAIHVVDLGAGAGANLRYLAPVLGGSQDWLLVDKDPLLLDAVTARMRIWADSCGASLAEQESESTIHAAAFECRVRTVSLDLAAGLDRLAFPRGALVSASALLDLVSENWLGRLAEQCANAAAPAWFALTYDGRIEWNPAEPEDAEVRRLFNAHQRTDKGFGPALGPDAAPKAAKIFASCGYRTCCEPSDWHIRPDQQALQHALLDGWDPEKNPRFENWRERRRAHIDGGRSEAIVGHIDMIGWPQ